MLRFAKPPQARGQLVLISTKIDDEISQDDPVRLLNEILGQINWTHWEACYSDHGAGRPPIHPRTMSGIILYGLLTKIRSSRNLEEALEKRIDFRWLAEGLSIDHSTLSEFRRKHGDQLKDLFIQVVLIAREMGLVSLSQLAYDGTKIRASNHRQRTRTPAELRTLQKELTEKFNAYVEQARREEEDQQFLSSSELPDELVDTKRRLDQIQKAIAELDRLDAADKTPPKRLPITDPESRVTPNKEGGMAPNYNPTAMVDTASGMMVQADVLSTTSEEHELMGAIDQVEKELGQRAEEVLADGLFATGENLEACDSREITLYSPRKGEPKSPNPAERDDLSLPVAAEEISQLPTRLISKKSGEKQFDKAAFIYDAEADCYWCPQGNQLEYRYTNHRKNTTGTEVERREYKASEAECAGCPLKEKCLSGTSKRRGVKRDQYEEHREKLSQRMKSDDGKQKYAKRCAPGERPFAVIKQQFGARQFLLRGLDRVKVEWDWLSVAFNIKILIGHMGRVGLSSMQSRAGPSFVPLGSAPGIT